MRYLVAILALGLLVAVHELGHLLFARLFRVRVDRYAVGFGPALFAFKLGRTEYSLRAIPLGGFVQIHGMNPYEEGLEKGDPTSYATLAPWKRALILLAGPLTNYALAVGLLCVLYVTGTHVPVPMTIGTVEPGSEAARAQLRPGDVVLSVDGAPQDSWSALVESLAGNPGGGRSLGILRHGDVITVPVHPRGDGRIGVQQQYVFKQHALRDAVGLAFLHTQRLAVDGLTLVWRLLRGKTGAEVSGPLAVVKLTSDAAGQSMDAVLRMLVALSVALAVFNVLPIPALDGGRVLFVLIEAVTGRALPAALETLLHLAGFALLIALMLWVAVSDARRLLGQEPLELASPMDAGAAPDAGR